MFGFFASSKSAKSNLEAAASWISAGFLTLKLSKGVVSRHNKLINVGMINFTSIRQELEPAGKDTISCPFQELAKKFPLLGIALNSPLVSAEITLAVSFQNYLGVPFTKTFPLFTQRASDGKLYWYHKTK